ncbi:MAG: asparagine synthase (glutamine-hydrolyzing) [Ignavibacteria bacterium]|nr:asparagine synthase (glutamine-hydrolyzing) [Ignavibacteria bacterium]
MCGIAGLINWGNETALENMTSVIEHRGPDDAGAKWFSESNTGLGHRRLSIIDLSPAGHQPMPDDSGKFWITFNGEIYNYKEIRNELASLGYKFKSHSDTEVILKAYQQWGVDSLAKFNGMFAFVIYDAENKKTFGARDRAGVKPFYYSISGSSLAFASEIKSILASGFVKPEIDFEAVYTPVHYQISPKTGFKNISKLPQGSYFVFHEGRFEINQYWKINPSENEITDKEAEEKLEELLLSSAEYQMVADVPVGLLLSGGLDSSIIAALMVKNTDKEIKSFTIKFKQEDLKLQGNVDDSYYAKKVAAKFNFNHIEILIEPNIVDLLPKMVWHLDEPIADPSSINTYLISKAARDNGIVVLLNGMGGDEIFSGYRSHLACLSLDYYQKIVPGFVDSGLRYIVSKVPQSSSKKNFKYVRWAKEFLNYSHMPRFERYISSGNVSLTDRNFNKYYLDCPYGFRDSFFYKKEKELFDDNNSSYLTKICMNDTRVYLPDHNLAYSDKAAMAASVEGRPPLTDHRIIEYMFSLPADLRIRKQVQKYILKKVSEKYLPQEIIYRPKAPFSAPMRAWLKGPLAEMVGDILSESSLKKRGIYNPQYITALIENNKKGIEDNSQLIWRLLTNEIWFRTFFDNSQQNLKQNRLLL